MSASVFVLEAVRVLAGRHVALWGIVGCLLLAGDELAAVTNGTYTGTTSQGKSISITVSGGSITGFSLGWSCGGSSGTFQSFSSCPIGAGGTFSCGTAFCSSTPFRLEVALGGTFSGTSVSGTITHVFHPCTFGCSCCTASGITYNAALPAPAISINDVSVTEGDSGTTSAQFEVTRSFDDGSVAMVDWATADGTADAGDYTSSSGQVTFNSGQTSKTVSVSVSGDTDPESDEIFYVDLTNPTNATIADSRGVCTIEDDDSPPTIKVVITLPIGDVESVDGFGDPDNHVLERLLARGSTKMTGVGWDVTISTVGESFLSEAKMYFDGSDRDGSGLFLTPGAGDDEPGTQSYSSPLTALVNLGIPDIPILDDGKLYIEFFEGFDDNPDSVDAVYEPGSTITIEYVVTPIFTDGFESGDLSAWSSKVPK